MTTAFPLALRLSEAAKALGISQRHLWQLTKDGRIPCVRLGDGSRKTTLYPVNMLREWLEAEASSQRPPGLAASPAEEQPKSNPYFSHHK